MGERRFCRQAQSRRGRRRLKITDGRYVCLPAQTIIHILVASLCGGTESLPFDEEVAHHH
jgi:hypothetical protein